MSFLNIRSLLPQRNSSGEGSMKGTSMAIPRKISASSGGDPAALFNAGSPGSSTSSNQIRYEEPIRLFIPDRRRAVLEKIVEPKPVNYDFNENTDVTPEPNVFIEDQYADNSTGSSWAFKFDFQKWSETNNIDEVCLQNFCSFLDREHGQMSLGSGQSKVDNQSGNPTHSMLTPPHSGDQKTSPTGPGNGLAAHEQSSAYHLLPSTQSANVPEQQVQLNKETCNTMRDLSAGRLERLAGAMRCLNPSHIIFRDHSCYAHRPTLLLFWFMERLQFHATRLTFDGIQANSPIPLDTLINYEDLEELTVIQPAQRPAFTVTAKLMLNWLKTDLFTRRPLRLVLRGCNNLSGADIAQFIIEWRKTSHPLIFDSILIDTGSVSVSEFLHQVENPISNQETDWRPHTPPNCSSFGIPVAPPPPSIRQYTFTHPKGNACIHYRYTDGHLVFICLPTKTPTKAALTMVRASSAQTFRQANSAGRIHRSGSTLQSHPAYNANLRLNSVDQLPSTSFVGKMFGFIMRSNA